MRDHLDEVVRGRSSRRSTPLLDAEADELCGAKRYERSPERLDTRAGHYTRSLHTKAGEVKLRVPRLRSLPFETQIIERIGGGSQRRGGAGGDVPGRSVGAACGGHHRGVVGDARQSRAR